jgi:peptidoglycan-N-acetylglucosamine deacetylase
MTRKKRETTRRLAWRQIFLPQMAVCLVALFLAAYGVGAVAKTPEMAPAKLSVQSKINSEMSLVRPQGAPAQVDCSSVPCLALSFDDGPNPITTPKVLDVLERHQVHATFFVVGAHIPGNEVILRRAYANGNEIGNHTWSHHNLKKLNGSQIREEIRKTQMAVMNAGVPAPHLFRPPYGEFDRYINSQIPMAIARWNVDPEDWKEGDPHVIADRIVTQARPGGVVDLHDAHLPTADALDSVVQNLKGRFHLVTVSQLFNLPPGERGEYFGR